MKTPKRGQRQLGWDAGSTQFRPDTDPVHMHSKRMCMHDLVSHIIHNVEVNCISTSKAETRAIFGLTRCSIFPKLFFDRPSITGTQQYDTVE